jgi:NifU-like protein involved in Fe-S cluster formation
VHNVYYYFQRACEREIVPLLGLPGDKTVDEDGNSVVFWIDSSNGRIAGVYYRCTTCFTLLALCEHVAELVTGMDIESARAFTPDQVLALHPEIPPERHYRATLAITALRSALDRQSVTQGVYA